MCLVIAIGEVNGPKKRKGGRLGQGLWVVFRPGHFSWAGVGSMRPRWHGAGPPSADVTPPCGRGPGLLTATGGFLRTAMTWDEQRTKEGHGEYVQVIMHISILLNFIAKYNLYREKQNEEISLESNVNRFQ